MYTKKGGHRPTAPGLDPRDPQGRPEDIDHNVLLFKNKAPETARVQRRSLQALGVPVVRDLAGRSGLAAGGSGVALSTALAVLGRALQARKKD